MLVPLEVFMPSDILPELSPEQDFARKLAARELVRYCEEFARWRRTKRGRAAVDCDLSKRQTPEVASLNEPEQSSAATSA